MHQSISSLHPVRVQGSMLHNIRSRASTPCCRSNWRTHAAPFGHLARGRAQRVHADAEQQAHAPSTPAQLVKHFAQQMAAVSAGAMRAQQQPSLPRLQLALASPTCVCMMEFMMHYLPAWALGRPEPLTPNQPITCLSRRNTSYLTLSVSSTYALLPASSLPGCEQAPGAAVGARAAAHASSLSPGHTPRPCRGGRYRGERRDPHRLRGRQQRPDGQAPGFGAQGARFQGQGRRQGELYA